MVNNNVTTITKKLFKFLFSVFFLAISTFFLQHSLVKSKSCTYTHAYYFQHANKFVCNLNVRACAKDALRLAADRLKQEPVFSHVTLYISLWLYGDKRTPSPKTKKTTNVYSSSYGGNTSFCSSSAEQFFISKMKLQTLAYQDFREREGKKDCS